MTTFKHKDFVGLDLAVDDFVAAMRPRYRQIVLGRVIKLTATKVRVEFQQKYIYKKTHLYNARDLVKLEGPHLTMKLLQGE